MNSNTRMYKTFSSEEISKLDIKITRKYYYFTENDIKEIKEQKFDNSSNEKLFQLVDDDYEWNPKQNNLLLDLSLSIKNCFSIFGKNGSCYEDAIIGVGLTWKPEKSRIKKCFKLGEITINDKNKILNVNSIELENISSNVAFRIFFYVIEPGTKGGNKFFGNERGMIIHDFIAWTIIMNGKGSIFPIYEIDDDNGPLWTFMCDVDDITEDYFDNDHIQIIINKKHPAYEFIHPKSENYNSRFLNDVMASAVASIIMKLRSQQPNNKIDLEQDFENGSILRAIKYFNDKLGFKVNGTYEEMLKSVKIFFDKEC